MGRAEASAAISGEQPRRRGKKIWIIFIIALAAVALAALLVYRHNITVTVSELTVPAAALPEEWDGLTIAQVSDLHNSDFDGHAQQLIDLLAAAEPDLIAVTGDLLDSYHPDLELALAFIREAVEIAPVYYVSGNHEARLPQLYQQLCEGMTEAGAVVLDDRSLLLQCGDSSIELLGLADPNFTISAAMSEQERQQRISARLEELLSGEGEYSILLSHRPELAELYAEAGIDLVLSGHAHGGQIRLPLIGALFAPNQGLFPKYTSGLYQLGETALVVSRGLGNSRFPFRINNPPELLIIMLQAD